MIESPRFHITASGCLERTVELQGTATIGRAADNDIVLEDATISQYHALLLTCLGGVILVDLDSTNGTFVNGMPAPPDEQVRLTDGDVIVIGGVVLHYETSLARHR